MSKRLFVACILLLLLAFTFVFWWKHGTQPVNTTDTSHKIFVIQKGTGIRAIANDLKKEGLIRDPVVFFLLVKKLGLDGKIQAGDFRLSPSQSAIDIAKNLTVGTLDIWITIPEGKRAEEIAEILKEKNPNYDPSWEGILAEHEGYLFPDTYLLPRDASIDQIITLLTNTFEKKYSSITVSPSNTLSKQQAVILASMIEREAKHAEDRPLIASVMINRLRIGMPLQIDSTVQYALGYQVTSKSWWKQDLTLDDLKIKSPYNTYINTGLPPTPISNPGLDVLQAALNPAKTDYLYYITDKNGINRYARTGEEHNANIRKYGL